MVVKDISDAVPFKAPLKRLSGFLGLKEAARISRLNRSVKRPAAR
jgi:hypothetical protein